MNDHEEFGEDSAPGYDKVITYVNRLHMCGGVMGIAEDVYGLWSDNKNAITVAESLEPEEERNAEQDPNNAQESNNEQEMKCDPELVKNENEKDADEAKMEPESTEVKEINDNDVQDAMDFNEWVQEYLATYKDEKMATDTHEPTSTSAEYVTLEEQ